jgi:hypothetical protein
LKQNFLFSLLVRLLITSGKAPPDNFLGLKKALKYHSFEFSLRTLVLHPSLAVAVGWESFPFILVATFLPAILVAMSHFTHMLSGAED